MIQTSELSGTETLGYGAIAYISISGQVFMPQLRTVDSGHFTQPEFSLQWYYFQHCYIIPVESGSYELSIFPKRSKGFPFTL